MINYERKDSGYLRVRGNRNGLGQVWPNTWGQRKKMLDRGSPCRQNLNCVASNDEYSLAPRWLLFLDTSRRFVLAFEAENVTATRPLCCAVR